MTRTILYAVALLIIGATVVGASVPSIINYQGKLFGTPGKPVTDGAYSLQFAIYDVPVGGTPLWSETNAAVQVKEGLFSVLLGSVINLPGNIFDKKERFFGVKVGTDPEMVPRQQIASVPFAMNAGSADRAETADNGVPIGGVIMWSGAVNNIPAGWALCDGQNGTPELRDRFIIGAGAGYTVGAMGGNGSVTISIDQMPSHSHVELGSWPGGVGGHQMQMTNTTVENGGQATNNSTRATGGGQPVEILPPYYALCFIMKVDN